MNASPPRRHLIAAFTAVYLIWGSTYLAIRYGIETLPPFLMAGARFFIAGALLYFWARVRGAARPTAAQWVPATVVGLALLAGGNGLVTWAELKVPSGTAALMVATVPLWMALIQTATDRAFRPRAAVWAGILLGFAGVAALAGVGAGPAARANSFEVGVLIVASVFWAAGSLYSRRAALPKNTTLSVAMQMLSGGGALLAAGALMGELPALAASHVSLRSVLALGYLILLGSIVGFTCYAWLLKEATPVAVSSYAYVNPVVAVILGWALAEESMTPRTIAAAACIVAGVVLMTFPGQRRRLPAATS